jgi:inhibitor of cysteine peptidase
MDTHQALSQARRTPRPLFWAVLAAALIVIAAAMMLNAFGSSGSDVAPTATTLTEVDLGRTVNVNVGDEIIIRLPSNPTTGYEWEIAALDEQRITSIASTYEAPQDGALGQGGTEVIRFRADAAGESTLALKYWRPWEGDASIEDEFSVTIRATN